MNPSDDYINYYTAYYRYMRYIIRYRYYYWYIRYNNNKLYTDITDNVVTQRLTAHCTL